MSIRKKTKPAPRAKAKPKAPIKMPVDQRAVVARLRRAMAKDGLTVRACRSDSRSWRTLGDWYVLDIQSNFIREHHCDLESLAREFGALQPHEALVGDE